MYKRIVYTQINKATCWNFKRDGAKVVLSIEWLRVHNLRSASGLHQSIIS